MLFRHPTAGLCLVLLTLVGTGTTPAAETKRPNILWIVVEDASPHVGCYGETTIETPHIDALARDGVRFTNAVVTNPVCSPCRSAMVTGLYQTTLGAHNHRSQRLSGKGGGNEAYYDSFRLPVPAVPEMLRDPVEEGAVLAAPAGRQPAVLPATGTRVRHVRAWTSGVRYLYRTRAN